MFVGSKHRDAHTPTPSAELEIVPVSFCTSPPTEPVRHTVTRVETTNHRQQIVRRDQADVGYG